MTRSVGTELYDLVRLKGRVDDYGSELVGRPNAVFGRMSKREPKRDPFELAFLHLVTWLYVPYFETGKATVMFLHARAEGYGVASRKSLQAHTHIVGRIRTHLHHNLDYQKSGDLATSRECQVWYREACNTMSPETKDDWKRCVLHLLSQASEHFRSLNEVLRSIERDARREVVLTEWRRALDRFHSPDAFDEIIRAAAEAMGRDGVDVAHLRRANYMAWVRQLNDRVGEYDFQREARRLVEDSLLQTPALLPITGEDIMRRFNLGPGREVGQLLAQARRIFETEPCSGDELLDRVRAGTGM